MLDVKSVPVVNPADYLRDHIGTGRWLRSTDIYWDKECFIGPKHGLLASLSIWTGFRLAAEMRSFDPRKVLILPGMYHSRVFRIINFSQSVLRLRIGRVSPAEQED